MISSDKMTKEDIEKHNPHCPKVPDYWYRILIIGSSASGKTNASLDLIKQQHNDDYSIINQIIYTLKIHMKQNINIKR